MSNPKRSSDLNDKPQALDWFVSNGKAHHHFNIAKTFLTSIYSADNHGFINTAPPQYRFNFRDDGYTFITVCESHSNVHIRMSQGQVMSKYWKYHREYERRGEVVFKITDPDSMLLLQSFFNDHQIKNFISSNPSLKSKQVLEVEFDEEVKRLMAMPLGAMPEGCATPEKYIVTSNHTVRDPKVKAWILLNANGICESCDEKAPFDTVDNVRYLEVHHLKRLADGGEDKPSNTVAICPNCHKEFHFGKNRDNKLSEIREKVKRILPR